MKGCSLWPRRGGEVKCERVEREKRTARRRKRGTELNRRSLVFFFFEE